MDQNHMEQNALNNCPIHSFLPQQFYFLKFFFAMFGDMPKFSTPITFSWLQEDSLKKSFKKTSQRMNIFSSNCVRTHEKPKPFVETFGEGSKRFLKINPPAIINIKDKRKNSGYITAF
ncbi:7647_t:CDS:2 [Entrophospora sp. SA101]|nr:7647_t:CDS:2 [Entrophospora sp. SA101]